MHVCVRREAMQPCVEVWEKCRPREGTLGAFWERSACSSCRGTGIPFPKEHCSFTATLGGTQHPSLLLRPKCVPPRLQSPCILFPLILSDCGDAEHFPAHQQGTTAFPLGWATAGKSWPGSLQPPHTPTYCKMGTSPNNSSTFLGAAERKADCCCPWTRVKNSSNEQDNLLKSSPHPLQDAWPRKQE